MSLFCFLVGLFVLVILTVSFFFFYGEDSLTREASEFYNETAKLEISFSYFDSQVRNLFD